MKKTNYKDLAGGMPFITLPMSVAVMLCEAAYWPCILARVPGNREEQDRGLHLDRASQMDFIQERIRAMVPVFAVADVRTRKATGTCRPEDFLFFLASVVGDAA